MTTVFGRDFSACSIRRSAFDDAVRTSNSNWSGKEAMTSKAATPTKPVEPRIATPFLFDIKQK